MTREEIEADIARLEHAWPYCPPETLAAVGRAIARLRADLAKVEGPAEGFVRLRIGIDRDVSGAHGMCAFIVTDFAKVDEFTIAVVTVDIPIPRVVEVAGTVETLREEGER